MSSSKQFTLRYPLSTSANLEGAFWFLELPPDLCKAIENDPNFPLHIKGKENDNAVLCTDTKTYDLRSITLSNNVLVMSAGSHDVETLELDLESLSIVDDASKEGNSESKPAPLFIRDKVNEIIELVPSVPKLDRLQGMLRGFEYDEGHEEDGEDVSDPAATQEEQDDRPRKRRRLTYDDIDSVVQASPHELSNGLRDRHILELKSALRPITTSHLTLILTLLLNAIVSLELKPSGAPMSLLIDALETDHEIRPTVTRQVMGWFGAVEGEGEESQWRMDQVGVVKQVGLGLLSLHRSDPTPLNQFFDRWKQTVGDSFEDHVTLNLLHGNFLLTKPSSNPTVTDRDQLVSYFPCSELPPAPAARFQDLFLTRARWKAEDINHFLQDVAVNNAARDAMLLKYARVVTDNDGTWYTAKNTGFM